MNREFRFPNMSFAAHYDPLWLKNNNMDESVLDGFSTRKKFEELFQQGVLLPGDELVLSLNEDINGQLYRNHAVFTFHGFRHGNFPDLTFRIIHTPVNFRPVVGELLACRGPVQLIPFLQFHGITGPLLTNSLIAQHIHIFRGAVGGYGGLYLGSLAYVKKAYHYWFYLRDEEAQRTGVPWRGKRAETMTTTAMSFKVERGGENRRVDGSTGQIVKPRAKGGKREGREVVEEEEGDEEEESGA